jgi:carboxylesterase type B
MESGNPLAYSNYRNTTYYQPFYDVLVTAAGCLLAIDSLDCLRDRPVALINTAIYVTNLIMTWQPIIDGDFIVRASSKQIADGAFVQVPIIDGANTDEGTAFSPLPVSDEVSFLSKLINPSENVNLPADLASALNAVYPNEPDYWIPSTEMLANTSVPSIFGDADEWRRSAAYYGDAYFIANRRGTCQAWAARGLAAYSYRFNTLPAGLPRCIGVTHFQEVAFVFNNTRGIGYDTNPFQGKPVAYQQLSQLMSSSWASFIHDLDPNSFSSRDPTIPAWPKYSIDQPQNMVWEASSTGLAYTEPDTFRQVGIQWILDHADAYQR